MKKKNFKEMKSNGKLISMRHQIQKMLEPITDKYKYSEWASKLYDGEGFYINHRTKVNKIQPIYGCDKHWAYGGVLKDKIFPISTQLYKKASPLGVVLCSFKHIKRRYKDFYYTQYLNKIESHNGRYYLFTTNLDFEIFTDLYVLDDLEVSGKKYFICDYLPLGNLIEKFYKEKQQDTAENKVLYEAAFYGMFAKQFDKCFNEKNVVVNNNDMLRLLYAMDDLNIKDFKKNIEKIKQIRYKEVIIATFQTAYLRHEEWKNFKKYKDKVVYMNTDSIYCDSPFDIKVENKLGCYDTEYNGENIFFIRRNAYVVLDKNGNVKKSVIGGVLNGGDITKDKIKKLLNKESIFAKTYNTNREIVDSEIKPLFLLNDNGNDFI